MRRGILSCGGKPVCAGVRTSMRAHPRGVGFDLRFTRKLNFVCRVIFKGCFLLDPSKIQIGGILVEVGSITASALPHEFQGNGARHRNKLEFPNLCNTRRPGFHPYFAFKMLQVLLREVGPCLARSLGECAACEHGITQTQTDLLLCCRKHLK